MRVMAESNNADQEDIPRAPPPSPELPQHHVPQFNFAELLLITSLKDTNSPCSSTEHSRPSSPLFYHSPDHANPPSGSVSPREQVNSPYNFSTQLSELTLNTPSSFHEVSNGFCNPALMTGKQLICGSLPVNGEMQAYMCQQESKFGSDFSGFLNSEQEEGTTTSERRRKISLKRQHDNQEYFYDTKPHGIEIIHKKLCHGNDHVGSAPSQARRSHTFSGSVRRPGSERLSLNTGGNSFQVGSVPGGHLSSCTSLDDQRPPSECLSPGSLKTIGFSTSGIANTDEQMEGVEMEGGSDVPTSVPISVTQMEWSNGGISLSGDVMPTNSGPQNSSSGFSFALPNYSTSYAPSSVSFHLNVPGFISDSVPVSGFLSGQQDQTIPQITLTPHHFSKSL